MASPRRRRNEPLRRTTSPFPGGPTQAIRRGPKPAARGVPAGPGVAPEGVMGGVRLELKPKSPKPTRVLPTPPGYTVPVPTPRPREVRPQGVGEPTALTKGRRLVPPLAVLAPRRLVRQPRRRPTRRIRGPTLGPPRANGLLPAYARPDAPSGRCGRVGRPLATGRPGVLGASTAGTAPMIGPPMGPFTVPVTTRKPGIDTGRRVVT